MQVSKPIIKTGTAKTNMLDVLWTLVPSGPVRFRMDRISSVAMKRGSNCGGGRTLGWEEAAVRVRRAQVNDTSNQRNCMAGVYRR